jgi:exonuclease SbcD
MCFDECNRDKKVLVIDFDEARQAKVQEITIPTFQRLEKIKGDLASLQAQIKKLKVLNESIWLEISYESDELQPNLRALLTEQTKDSQVEILKLINHQRQQHYLQSEGELESLDELSVDDVFKRLLERQNIPEAQQSDLLSAYQEVVHRLQHEEDSEQKA